MSTRVHHSLRWFAIAALVAVAGSAGAGADRATAVGGVTFGGLSSQDRPIVVEVTPRRGRVARVLWDWEGTCAPGPAATPDTPLVKRASDRTNPQQFRVNRLGRWGGRYTAGPFPDPATGATETYGYKLTGRFMDRGTRMAGTIRVTYTQLTATGAPIRTCRSGLITYTLRD